MTRPVLLGLAFLTVVVSVQADDEPPVAAAARRRSESIRSVVMKYRLEKAIEPGGEWVITSGGVVTKRMPETRVVGDCENRFVLEGSKFRAETVDVQPHLKERDRIQVRVFDGQYLRGFSHRTTDPPVAGRGSLQKPSQNPHADMTVVDWSLRVPVVFREPAVWQRWGKWEYVGSSKILFGDRTDEYRLPLGPGTESERLRVWTDPTRDHLILGVSWSPQHQLHISYARHVDSGVWLPSGWTERVWHKDGGLRSTTVATVTSIVLNPPIPPHEFVLRFPKGLSVSDQIRDIDCIVSEDGELVPKSPAGGQSLPDQKSQRATRREGVVIVLSVVGVLFAIVVTVRFRRERATPPPTG